MQRSAAAALQAGNSGMECRMNGLIYLVGLVVVVVAVLSFLGLRCPRAEPPTRPIPYASSAGIAGFPGGRRRSGRDDPRQSRDGILIAFNIPILRRHHHVLHTGFLIGRQCLSHRIHGGGAAPGPQ